MSAQDEVEVSAEDADGDELSQMLANIDVDVDFNCFEGSFRMSDEKLAAIKEERNKLERKEIYSKLYKPSSEEEAQIKDIAHELQGRRSLTLWSSKHPKDDTVNSLLNLDFDEEGQSILLKEGNVTCEGEKRELLLLTHGLLVLIPKEQSQSYFSKCKAVDTAEKFKDVHYVIDHSYKPEYGKSEEEISHGFTIEFENGNKMSIICPSEVDKDRWIYAIKKTVVQTLTRTFSTEKKVKGWQHGIVQCSIFSSAFWGDVTTMKRMLALNPDEINTLDEHGYSALHYSVMYEHYDCIEFLLKSKASTKIQTGLGTSLLDLVESQKTLDVLRANGVKCEEVFTPRLSDKDKLFEGANSGKGRVDDSGINDTYDSISDVKETMNKTMDAFGERGEKLQNMQNKTAELKDDAAEYKELGKKLKEKTKKSWFA